MRRLAEKLLVNVAPRRVRGWIVAMIAEAQCLDSGERLGWYRAAAQIAISQRLSDLALPLQATALAAVMVTVDWLSGNLVPALALIALSAVVLTRSSTGWIPMTVAGGGLPLAHAIANWVPALRPQYQYAPLDVRDWVILACVGAIGVSAVQVATALRYAWKAARC